ncbi:MAG: HutD family protein [Bacteroidota bacterium]|nr:HutD family protein [Bacteroidota bacterium]
MQTIKRADIKTAAWSGGTTTELYIFPDNSSYTKRNFDFRISSAKVEVEESTFTSLNGISREIMILDGEIELEHRGHYKKALKKFETDSFKGDWHTTSKGKVTDFNLMTRGKYSGEIIPYILEKEEKFDNSSIPKAFIIVLYILKGEIKIDIPKQSITAKHGDVIIFNSFSEWQNASIIAAKKSEIIVSVVIPKTYV